MSAWAQPRSHDRAHAPLPGPGQWTIPRPHLRQACTRIAARMLSERGPRALGGIHAATVEALGSLEREGAFGAAVEARVARFVIDELGPEPSGRTGLRGVAPPRDDPGPPTPASSARMVRDLLYVCVHPTLPAERQLCMLLRFGFWLPNEAAAAVLQVHPSTVGIHLRQSCRRLGAVARRGGRPWAAGTDPHALSVLNHLDRLRRRGLELRTSAPRIAEALVLDAPVHASLLLEAESGPAKAEAHAFLAELYLGAEVKRRREAAGDPGRSLRAAQDWAGGDALPKGLRHLRVAQELGAASRFVWLARIHAGYALAAHPTETDWQAMVGLYEGLLRVSVIA
ncbi:MAG TPA: hypothetical protein VFU23_02825 [Gemmatimonadales bacterium]|nr:hypothetical protein [Gemmatimonadales bacterium]